MGIEDIMTKKYEVITAKVIKPKKIKYNKQKLDEGMNVEKEHTPNKRLQATIAKNHLDESVNYYRKLKFAERKRRDVKPRLQGNKNKR